MCVCVCVKSVSNFGLEQISFWRENPHGGRHFKNSKQNRLWKKKKGGTPNYFLLPFLARARKAIII